MITFADDDLEVLFAAMLSMVEDNHSAQDQLSPEQWERAERVYAQLNTRIAMLGDVPRGRTRFAAVADDANLFKKEGV